MVFKADIERRRMRVHCNLGDSIRARNHARDNPDRDAHDDSARPPQADVANKATAD